MLIFFSQMENVNCVIFILCRFSPLSLLYSFTFYIHPHYRLHYNPILPRIDEADLWGEGYIDKLSSMTQASGTVANWINV